MPDSQDNFTWTKRQRDVIDLPIAARALVIADAGTGKTAVLIGRLESLIAREDLAAGSEVVVLSFTRAAVGEIRQRLRNIEGAARYATIATFDSFATRFLARASDDEAWHDCDYDGRIEKATELLESEEAPDAPLGAYRHIFVDEIQDLVGVRNRFVQAILKAADAGFSLFGDPAQAIYDYQLRLKGLTETSIFAWVEEEYDGELRILSLGENHRSLTKEAAEISRIGELLKGSDPDYAEVGKQLWVMARGLPEMAGPAGAAPTLRRVKSPTAVLCRTNGEALVLSGDLQALGINHHLRRGATEQSLPRWIARVIGPSDVMRIGRNNFRRRYEAQPDETRPSADDAWCLLKRVDRTSGDVLDLARLRDGIMRGRTPDELTQSPSGNVIVSTVHRAKGLEFDTVIILEPHELGPSEDSDQLAEEVRTLYVGMTRPRRYLMRLTDLPMQRVYRDTYVNRWVRGGFQQWQTFGFELLRHDVDRSVPPGSSDLDSDPLEVQDYLWDAVQPGDGVDLEFVRSTSTRYAQALFSVVHDGKAIGITSESFGRALGTRLHRGKAGKQWPKAIEGIRIDCVETIPGPAAAAQNCGLGAGGFWLIPRLVGLGRIKWS